MVQIFNAGVQVDQNRVLFAMKIVQRGFKCTVTFDNKDSVEYPLAKDPKQSFAMKTYAQLPTTIQPPYQANNKPYNIMVLVLNNSLYHKVTILQ